MTKRTGISGISIAVILITIVVAILYKYNLAFTTFVNQQIPTLTGYSINSVVLCIIVLGFIIALMFRIQPDRDRSDDGNDDIIYPPDSPSHPQPPDPPMPQEQQVPPIIQPIVIQPIIKEPIHQPSEDPRRYKPDNRNQYNYDIHQTSHDTRQSSNQNQSNQHKPKSNYHTNYNQKKRPIIRNYWQPKKKKRIIKNFWNKDDWER